MTIRSNSVCFFVILLLSLSPYAMAQEPAPVRDLTGVWEGEVNFDAQFAEMTAFGQEQFDANRPFSGPRAGAVAESNDGYRMCDPLGFPRNVHYELRGSAFAEMPGRMLMLMQYMRHWREIWTDGRELPTNAGTYELDAPDPRYNGYSVGRWEDDYTFVINTTGFHEDIWADEQGHPISVDAQIEERYHRVDHDNLELTVTINDPINYTEPFMSLNETLRWDEDQEFEEQLCIPSQALEYIRTFAPER
jgi:hypothetical protein